MIIILLSRILSVAYEAGRVLDGWVTAGTLDNSRAAVLEAQAESRARAELDAARDRKLAHPA